MSNACWSPTSPPSSAHPIRRSKLPWQLTWRSRRGPAHPSSAHFDVYQSVRVCIISGESGGQTLQETARRICAAKGIKLADANVLWDFDLPHLANARHVEELRDGIETHDIEVLILDPLYLCVLAGDSGKSLEASNLFQMGPLFRRFGADAAERRLRPHPVASRPQTRAGR